MSCFNDSDGRFTGFIICAVAWKRCTWSWRFYSCLSCDKCMSKVKSLSSPTLKTEGHLWNEHSITRWRRSMFRLHLPTDGKLNSWREISQCKRTILIILPPTGGGCRSPLRGRRPCKSLKYVFSRFEVLLLMLGEGPQPWGSSGWWDRMNWKTVERCGKSRTIKGQSWTCRCHLKTDMTHIYPLEITPLNR